MTVAEDTGVTLPQATGLLASTKHSRRCVGTSLMCLLMNYCHFKATSLCVTVLQNYKPWLMGRDCYNFLFGIYLFIYLFIYF